MTVGSILPLGLPSVTPRPTRRHQKLTPLFLFTCRRRTGRARGRNGPRRRPRPRKRRRSSPTGQTAMQRPQGETCRPKRSADRSAQARLSVSDAGVIAGLERSGRALLHAPHAPGAEVLRERRVRREFGRRQDRREPHAGSERRRQKHVVDPERAEAGEVRRVPVGEERDRPLEQDTDRAVAVPRHRHGRVSGRVQGRCDPVCVLVEELVRGPVEARGTRSRAPSRPRAGRPGARSRSRSASRAPPPPAGTAREPRARTGARSSGRPARTRRAGSRAGGSGPRPPPAVLRPYWRWRAGRS